MNVIDSKVISILVVDDDPQICEMLTVILQKEDFQVISTFRSRETLGFLRKGSHINFDLVITDLQMPGQGGYSIIKDLQSPDFNNVPVLVVTGRNLDAGTLEMIQNEPNVKGVCKKPLSVADFLKKVHEILGTFPKNPEPSPTL